MNKILFEKRRSYLGLHIHMLLLLFAHFITTPSLTVATQFHMRSGDPYNTNYHELAYIKCSLWFDLTAGIEHAICHTRGKPAITIVSTNILYKDRSSNMNKLEIRIVLSSSIKKNMLFCQLLTISCLVDIFRSNIAFSLQFTMPHMY